MFPPVRGWRSMFFTALLLGMAACSAIPTPPASPGETSVPPEAATSVPTQTVPPTIPPSPEPSLTPTPPALNLSNPQKVVLAENLPGPDDLVLAPDQSIYVSDVIDGTVKQVTPDGLLHAVVGGLSAPEGMVFLPDGSLVIAEQGANRLVRYDFQTKTLSPFLTLTNRTGLEGVDGIALDARPGNAETLIVPDSPNGIVRRVGLDGQVIADIQSGFARPTGAWVEPDGSILVTDENAAALVRIRADGQVEKLASLSTPDDVIEDAAGNIFVATLGDHAVHVLLAATHQDVLLAGDFIDPQGIIFDADGNLVVADAGNHRLVKLLIH